MYNIEPETTIPDPLGLVTVCLSEEEEEETGWGGHDKQINHPLSGITFHLEDWGALGN